MAVNGVTQGRTQILSSVDVCGPSKVENVAHAANLAVRPVGIAREARELVGSRSPQTPPLRLAHPAHTGALAATSSATAASTRGSWTFPLINGSVKDTIDYIRKEYGVHYRVEGDEETGVFTIRAKNLFGEARYRIVVSEANVTVTASVENFLGFELQQEGRVPNPVGATLPRWFRSLTKWLP